MPEPRKLRVFLSHAPFLTHACFPTAKSWLFRGATLTAAPNLRAKVAETLPVPAQEFHYFIDTYAQWFFKVYG